MPDLTAALQFAQDLAGHAGAMAREHFDLDLAFDPKDDNSPITQADTAINSLVIAKCKAAYPDVGVLAEEESSPGPSKLLWVCDPIDGTIPYMLGAQASTFCLALVDDGQPVVGVVYDFGNDRMYSAIKGQGAWLNGKPLLAPTNTPLKLADVEIYPGSSYKLGTLRDEMNAKGWHTCNYASSGFMGMAVVTGRTAAVVYTGNKAWDVAASKVIVEECGGKITDLAGESQRYDDYITGAIITGPKLGEELRKLVLAHYHSNN